MVYLDTVIDETSQVQSWCQLIDAERHQRILDSGTALQGSIDLTQTAIQNLSIRTTEEQARISLKLEDVLRSLEQPLQRLIDSAAEFHDNLARNQRLEILRWMSTVPYREHHKSSISDVLDQSGAWLQNDPQFIEWRSSSISAILWLHGIRRCS